MTRTPPLQPPPRIDPRPGPESAPTSERQRPTRHRRPRPWVVALMAVLGIGLVAVVVVLPKLVDVREETQPADTAAGSTVPTPAPMATAVPPNPARPADEGVRRTVTEALDEGRAALAARDAAAAIAAFGRAAALEPGNSAAENGLRQSERMAEAQTLEAAALAHEERRETEAATRAARRALSIEPTSETARGVLRRAALAAENASYRDLVTRGLDALEAKRYQEALDVFSSAAERRPEAPEVMDGLARARTGLERQTINGHLARAAEAEEGESWALAVAEYRSVLALDPTLATARDGEARSSRRLELIRRIDFHLANPDRLATTEVLDEAADLVAEAKAVASRGPRLNDRIDHLDRLVTQSSIPVPVALESDGLTEVVVFRVGELGTFENHTIELRPGTYTVVGRRNGFRDVRLVIKVGPGQSPPTVRVSCTEAI